jgi:hypothetical protein
MNTPSMEMKNCTYNPRNKITSVNAVHIVLEELISGGLTLEDIIACYVSRRMSPLLRWTHKICQMSGPMDPTRHSSFELSPANILRRVKDICKTAQTEFAWGLEPYSQDRPAPVVLVSNVNSFSLQKFSFQGYENSKITIALDRTVPDPEDPDHDDKMPKNTRAGLAVGKTSSRHSIKDWSDDDSDRDCQMLLDPMPLAFSFLAMPTSGIPDSEVVDATPLNQGLIGKCASKKQGV